MTNATIAASADPWYNYFKEDQPESQWLLTAFGVRVLWAMLGVLSNLAMVYITAVSKSLHGVCNILIALESFFAIFQDASYLVSFFVFLSGVKFITYRLCFPMLILTNICGSNAQLIMVLTGVDRLLCILFPIWYKTRNKTYYLLCMGIIVALFSGYGFTIKFIGFLENQQIMMTCSTHDMMPGSLTTLISIQSMAMSVMLMTVYTAIWFLGFILRPIAESISVKNKKIIKALICIIGLNMLGVFFKEFMVFLFANYWKVSIFVKTSFTIGMSFLTITVYSVNAPVLYLFSTLYREQFNARFKCSLRLFNTRTAPSSTLAMVANEGQQQQQHTMPSVSISMNQQRPCCLQHRCLPNCICCARH